MLIEASQSKSNANDQETSDSASILNSPGSLATISIFSSTLSFINSNISYDGKTKTKKFLASVKEKKEFEELITKLNDLALNKQFNKKIFNLGGKSIERSPIFNFFLSKIDLVSDKNLEFICIHCYTILTEDLSTACSNLTHHLKKRHNNGVDTRMEKWFTAFSEFTGNIDKPCIDANTMNLVKYFISSNAAYKEIKNKYLRALLQVARIKMPGLNSFTESILPDVVKKVRILIGEKLRQSSVVILIVDIWSTAQMADFMGLAAMVCNKNLEKECYVIGMERMPGSHNAENIQLTIELITNQYDFDKSKIKGIVCDEGSSLVRLFGQIFDDDDDDDDDDENYDDGIKDMEKYENEKLLYMEKKLALDLEETIGTTNNGSSLEIEEENAIFNYSVPSFTQVDNELGEIVKDMQILNLETQLKGEILSDVNSESENGDKNEYLNLQDASPLKDLCLCIGSDSVPRFSCACHKSNLAVRKAIKSSKTFTKNLAKLTKFAAKIRSSNLKSKIFEQNHTRLRCENCTRWSSSFLMLFQFYKAYKNECFKGELTCPVSFETIEFYLQILWPAYKFTIGLQRTQSNISEVIPSLLFLFKTWDSLAQNKEFKPICEKLVFCFKQKFDFELNSGIYSVAALLNTSKLKLWFSKPFASDQHDRSIKSLVKVATDLIEKTKNDLNDAKENEASYINTNKKEDDDGDFFDQLYRSDYDENVEIRTCLTEKSQIEEEKEIFLATLEDASELTLTTNAFWLKYRKRLPNLFKIAMQLLSIPSSSAFIERFFSICGVICKKRCGNMSDATIISRSFLKTNLRLLDKLIS